MTRGALAGDSTGRELEWRMWLRAPDGTSVSIMRLEAVRVASGRAVDLTGGLTVPLLQLADSLPGGTWEIGSRLVDAATGATVALRTTRFVLVAAEALAAEQSDPARLRSAVDAALLFRSPDARALLAESRPR